MTRRHPGASVRRAEQYPRGGIVEKIEDRQARSVHQRTKLGIVDDRRVEGLGPRATVEVVRHLRCEAVVEHLDVMKVNHDLPRASDVLHRRPIWRVPLNENDAVLVHVISTGAEQSEAAFVRAAVEQVAECEDGIETSAKTERPNVLQYASSTDDVREHFRRTVDSDDEVPLRRKGIRDAPNSGAEVEDRRLSTKNRTDTTHVGL